jgi:hypothetical protein
MATETYELRIAGNVQGQYNEVVSHWQGSGLTADDTFGSGVSLTGGWVANLQTLWLALFPGSYFLNFIVSRRVILKPSVRVFGQYQAFAAAGTRGATATSWNLCPSTFLIPPMGVKSGGKCFLPCVAQADIVNNQYIAGYKTAHAAYFNAAITGFTTSGINWKLAILSRRLNVSHLVNNISLSERIGFQSKRRYPGN